MRDRQKDSTGAAVPGEGRWPSAAGRFAFLVLVPALALTVLVVGVACRLRAPQSAPDDRPPPPMPGGLFHNWPRPDFVLVLSAQQHGYLLPCGCSRPQYGGLERRYNFIQKLRDERGWKVVPLDLGDLAQKEGPAKMPNVQGLIKYRYTMKALKEMGYLASSFGEYEAALPLTDALDNYALNEPRPAVLAANLIGKEKDFPDDKRRSKSYVGSWEVAEAAPGLKVGVAGIIGTYAPERDSTGTEMKSPGDIISELTAKKSQFARADAVVPQVLAEMQHDKDAADFRVLLYQGSVEKAKLLAKSFPDFQVILCLSVEDEPPARPEVVGNTFVVRVGHKGKNLGVVGVKQTGKRDKPFELFYQLATLGEEYETPAGKEAGHPILALMEQYTRELKADDYLAKYRQGMHSVQFGALQIKDEDGSFPYRKPVFKGVGSEYAGSKACERCHKHAYKVWQDSAHSHAYQTLVDARRPSNRQFDPECIVCHVVGYTYRTGFTDADKTPHLKDVGCESCHGPSRAHVVNPNDDRLYPLINPWKAKPGETKEQRDRRMLAIERMCQHCHDHDNDVHWTFEKWEKKNIIHMTPKEEDK